MLKETQFFIKSSIFQRVSIKANVGNLAIHSFYKIMLFFSESYEFFNILKFIENLVNDDARLILR